MTMPRHLSAEAKRVWVEIVESCGESVEGPDLEAYVGQVLTLREARRRIAKEGLIVADPKGFPVPHPAIAIERAAQDEIRKWGSAFKPSSRPRR